MEMIVFIALLIIAGKAIAKHQVQKEEQDRRDKIEQARRMAKLQREQVIQAQEQARLAKEQEKQAEILRKHEERLAKLEEKATIACYTIEHYEPILEKLYKDLEQAELEINAATFSANDGYQNEVISVCGLKSAEDRAQKIRDKIYSIDLKLAKARSAMAEYERAKETA